MSALDRLRGRRFQRRSVQQVKEAQRGLEPARLVEKGLAYYCDPNDFFSGPSEPYTPHPRSCRCDVCCSEAASELASQQW